MERLKNPYIILGLVTILCIFILSLCPPIPQSLRYHQFADARTIGGIPNFWNVISNLPFLIIGIFGIKAINQAWQARYFIDRKEVLPFIIIFLGLILTAFGSSFYHLAPDNYRLVWDRHPLTLVFMGFLSLTIMERVNFSWGFWLLPFLILLGLWSVDYWIRTEALGRGDLRPYIFVHFYSIILIMLILYLFPKPYPSTFPFLLLLIFYGLATFFEWADEPIYHMGEILSGHTLKHLFAALATYGFIVMVEELASRN